MKLAIDVQYEGTSALVAGVVFQDWGSNDIVRTLTIDVNKVEPYEPGAFYKRELPCILELLKHVTQTFEVIVIDGFVKLGPDEVDGLGMHLYRAVNERTPIIGVAKKPFAGTPQDYEVYRGDSAKPLLVSSVGVSLSDAKTFIRAMHGKHRLPTLLKKVDQLCRGIKG